MRFAPPSRLIGRGGDPTATSQNVDPDYPLTNLTDGLPTEVTRWTVKTGTRIVWDLGVSPTWPIEGLLIVMHTISSAYQVLVQANNTDVWTSPSYSHYITVPNWTGGASQWVLPPNLFADFRATTLGTVGYRYISIYLPEQPWLNHAIGEVCWVSEWMEMESSIAWPVQRAEIRRVSVNSTSYGIEHVVDRKVHQRRLSLAFRSISDTDRNTLLELMREVGANETFAMVLDVHETTDFHSSAEALLVRVHPDNAANLVETLQFFGVHDVTLDVIEVQRGLAL